MNLEIAADTRSLDVFKEYIEGSDFQSQFEELCKHMDPWKAMGQVQKTIHTYLKYPNKNAPSDDALSVLMKLLRSMVGPKEECQCVRCRLGKGEEVSDKEIADHFRMAVAKYNDCKKKYSETKQDLYIQLAEVCMGFFISDFEGDQK